MFRSRKRIRKRFEPEKKTLPVSRLGAEFEWDDNRLKIALGAYPVPKRLVSNARLDMVLSLGLYYDDVSKTWQPLSAVDISTVRNQGRFYYTPPSELTFDQWANLRINNLQELLIHEQVLDDVMNGEIVNEVMVGPLIKSYYVDIDPYLVDHIVVAVWAVQGSSSVIQVQYAFPDDSYIPLINLGSIATSDIQLFRINDWNRFYLFLSCGTGDAMSLRIHFLKNLKGGT